MKKIFLFFSILLTSFFAILPVQAGLLNKSPQFLPADQAFQLSVEQQDHQLTLDWHIADGYYLYKKEIRVQGQQVDVGELHFPTPEIHQDEFFGAVEIFRHQLHLAVALKDIRPDAKVEVIYQGCTTGLCYPPESKLIDLKMVPNGDVAKDLTMPDAQKTMPNLTAVSAENVQNTPLAEQDRLAQDLSHSKYTIFWFFLLGIGLAFTPCVLPMLPLLSAIVIGTGQRPNNLRALSLSIVYVQGMALTYTLLGLVVAAIGLPFQVALQSLYVLVGLSIVFVLLALSMFGVFTLQLPASLQTKLTQISQKQQGGALGGVFIMGMLAGLVASPCTSAPLSGALLYVAQSGDLWTGAATLYLLALGMGMPLIAITLFGNRILPKSGDWLNSVKNAFGFVMLALPVFLLSRVLPEWEALMWSALGMAFFIWLAFSMGQSKLGWVLRIVFFIIAIVLAKPLQNWLWQTPEQAKNADQKSLVFQPQFKRIKNYAELQQALADNPHKIAMLDFYADWCVACKEFEKYTFSDPNVQKTMQDILLLQVDMSKNSSENKALSEKLNILGLPTILFFNQQAMEISGSRVNGFMSAEPFNQWLKMHLEKN